MSQVEYRLTFKPSFRDIKGRFTRATNELLRNKQQAVRRLSSRFVGLLQEEAPRKTGEFARGIKARAFTRGETTGFTIGMPQPLAKWIIEGTNEHPIPKVGRKLLSFYWPNGPRGAGDYVFWSVQHPGTKPNPFPKRAHARWLPEAEIEMARVALNWQEDFTRG